MRTNEHTVLMYGTTWCGDCHRAKRVLEAEDVPYQWINIEHEPGAADAMARLNGGLQSVPTILLPDGSVLVEPSNRELTDRLRSLVP